MRDGVLTAISNATIIYCFNLLSNDFVGSKSLMKIIVKNIMKVDKHLWKMARKWFFSLSCFFLHIDTLLLFQFES